MVTLGLVRRTSGKGGTKTWGVSYRANGARCRQKLGSSPQSESVGARAVAREVQRRADTRIPP